MQRADLRHERRGVLYDRRPVWHRAELHERHVSSKRDVRAAAGDLHCRIAMLHRPLVPWKQRRDALLRGGVA